MTKRKNFRNFYDSYEEDEWGDKEPRFAKKDSKRYDKKKAKIQNARKQKAKQKDSLFS
jgi:hypothetical protein